MGMQVLLTQYLVHRPIRCSGLETRRVHPALALAHGQLKSSEPDGGGHWRDGRRVLCHTQLAHRGGDI